MLPDPEGIETVTSWSPVKYASHWTTKASLYKIVYYGYSLKLPQVEVIQKNTHNIYVYKENHKKILHKHQ